MCLPRLGRTHGCAPTVVSYHLERNFLSHGRRVRIPVAAGVPAGPSGMRKSRIPPPYIKVNASNDRAARGRRYFFKDRLGHENHVGHGPTYASDPLFVHMAGCRPSGETSYMAGGKGSVSLV
jgi:hypothetical protein